MFFPFLLLFSFLQATVVPDQGNWVKKREWMYEARQDVEKMLSVEASLRKKEASYKERIASMDDKLNAFYVAIGIQKGQVLETFKDVEAYIESRFQKTTAQLENSEIQGRLLTQRELEVQLFTLKKNVKAEKDEIAQLSIDMQSIWDHETRAKEIARLVSQKIASVKDIIKQAEQILETIDQTKNHIKAAELRYQIQNILREVEAIDLFVQNSAKAALDQVIEYVNQKSVTLEKAIAESRAKGLFIENQAQELAKEEKEEKEKNTKEAEREIEKKLSSAPPPSLFQKIAKNMHQALVFVQKILWMPLRFLGW